MTEGIQMHALGSIKPINLVFGNKVWWYMPLRHWNWDFQHCCCVSDFIRNFAIISEALHASLYCRAHHSLILPFFVHTLLFITPSSRKQSSALKQQNFNQSRLATPPIFKNLHFSWSLFLTPCAPHSFSQNTPTKILVIKKVRSLLATIFYTETFQTFQRRWSS